MAFILIVSPIIFADPDIIKPGQNINDVADKLGKTGYKETGLDMAPLSQDLALKMWAVGEGVLIFSYSKKDKIIKGISFFLCDERPKNLRKSFDFIVKEFDPIARELKIIVP